MIKGNLKGLIGALLLGWAVPTAALAEANVSVMTLPYVGWKVDIPHDENRTGKVVVQPASKQGRQIAASVAFYSFEFCKKWFGEVHAVGNRYISAAKASNPKEFAAYQGSIRKAVKEIGLRKDRATCAMMTEPYQSGGDVALVLPWGYEGFYPEYDE